MPASSNHKALQAAAQFINKGETVEVVERYGQGIIHDTCLVTLRSNKRFILQRINDNVFTDPAAIMHNLKLVCEHINQQMGAGQSKIAGDWQMLQTIPAGEGSDFFVDADGSVWRALTFIDGAVPLERIAAPAEAREVGRALGFFHRLTSDLSPELLQNTLPGFHNIEQYLEHYDAAADRGKIPNDAEKFCHQFIAARRDWAPVLENALRSNKLRKRVIHGDPKINNIMIDRSTGRAVSIIDLDTVMAGLVHYDIGDCLRSCCNTVEEDSAALDAVKFDLERCEAVLAGYATAARDVLTENDLYFLFDAVRLIPFELGLRFYTDFLEGNAYFKVSRQNQNLERARVQFGLVESIENQEEEIRSIIDACCIK